ncbi:MAG: DUF4185 domain-containing protein [Cryobacterium sp.]|nr:DUF4185 domain-containing protein [Cryobacterium sp.]
MQDTGVARSTRIAAVSLVSVTALALTGCAVGTRLFSPHGEFVLDGVTGVRQIGAVTGPDSPGRTDKWAVDGTDLGSMFEYDGKVWFVFGDTFGERTGVVGGGGSFWRSNTMGWTNDTDPSNGITIDGMILDEVGLAKELLPSKKVDNVEMTVIPTHGFAVGSTMYLHWMSVRHWGIPGEWEVNDSGLAKSTDNGQNWTILDSPRWSGESGFVQIAPAIINEGGTDWVYMWGITHGRYSGVSLMKVEATKVEDSNSYLYFTGIKDDSVQWSTDSASATLVLDDTVGELSVVWNEYLQRWIMSYLKEGSGAVLREGLTPWGPWGEPYTLVGASEVPGPYAPFMNPRFTADGGKTIYFGLSIWNPYNVFWYRAELVKK